jgi:antitoxin VapB
VSITTVFTNNRSQAVRLPADVRLPEGVRKVDVRAKGRDRIISPVGHTWDEFFHNGPVASDDFMAERAPQHQVDREEL